ncbi:hypothetical protein [Homoserinimonas hongtaonis]|uniref:hypothetical protein n=1 Tax=Homoserinimonas hongtaonis TaxID=2079791 RepID=UPI00131EEF01|nr:hypothetical protein [Salinibacterium hongtaonis]
MTLLAGSRPTSMPTAVSELQARIRQMQATKLPDIMLPVLDGLRSILPHGLRAGATYSVTGSTSLALALLAGPSQQGSWCGVLGVPTLSTEAAAELGIDLSRLVLVPQPGSRWLSVAAAMTDVLGVVVAAAPPRIAPAEASRLAARLRQRESTLIVLGEWPGADASIRATASTWSGIGNGHGRLAGRLMRVEVGGRDGRSRTRTLILPFAPTSGTGATAAAVPGAAMPDAAVPTAPHPMGLRLAPELVG